MQKRCISLIAAFIVSAFGWVACDDIDIVSPPGPRGFSAYEVWVESVKNGKIHWTEGTDLPNYFKYIKGEKGDTGESAFITWKDWIKDGMVDDPHQPGQKWSPSRSSKKDFFIFLTGAKGEDGLTPFVNEKGNWQIGSKDTGIPARGRDGKKGDKGDTGAKGDKGDPGAKGDKGDPGAKGENGGNGAKGDKGDPGAKDVVEIRNGFWYINGVNTNVRAEGRDGTPGVGKSAFQLWVEEVKAGTIFDKEGTRWSDTKVQLSDFWDYLKGKDGKDGGPGGGGTAPAPLEKTPLTIVSYGLADKDPKDSSSPILTQAPAPVPQPKPIPEPHPGPPPTPEEPPKCIAQILIKTAPRAKVFLQSSGTDYNKKGGTDQLKVYEYTADEQGQYTLRVEVSTHNQMAHIWAEESGKLPSYQHHLSLGYLLIDNGGSSQNT